MACRMNRLFGDMLGVPVDVGEGRGGEEAGWMGDFVRCGFEGLYGRDLNIWVDA